MITVRLPETLRDGRGAMVTMNAASLHDIIDGLELEEDRDELYNFAVNGELIIHGVSSGLKGDQFQRNKR